MLQQRLLLLLLLKQLSTVLAQVNENRANNKDSRLTWSPKDNRIELGVQKPPDWIASYAQACSDTWCSSPAADGGSDCWACTASEPCTCSHGTAKGTGETRTYQGTTYHKYTCCNDGIGADEYRGDYKAVDAENRTKRQVEENDVERQLQILTLPNTPAYGGTCGDPDPNATGAIDYICPPGYWTKNGSTSSACTSMSECNTNCCKTPFCWGDSGYGGTCPTGETWTNVKIYSTHAAFVAVDQASL